MKRSHAKKLVLGFMRQNHPVALIGGVGIGKTVLINECATELQFGPIRTQHLSQMSPVDVRGVLVPDFEARLASWLRPAWFPVDGNGVVFLDELDKADLETQKAALQLMTERRIGENQLGKDVRLVMAANRPEDDAMSQAFSEAIRSRISWVVLDADKDEWIEYAGRKHLAEPVVAFIATRGDEFLHRKNQDDIAMPTPRTWDRVGDMWDEFKGEDRWRMVRATVGEVAGREFRAFEDIYRRLDPETMLRDGTIVDHNENAGMHIASVIAVSFFLRNAKKVQAGWKVGAFLEKVRPELIIVFCKQLPEALFGRIAERADCTGPLGRFVGIVTGLDQPDEKDA